jgi:hypothetical protein
MKDPRVVTVVTRENYFSPENSMHYMGASQFKAFVQCPAAALAEIRGEYSREATTSLLVGQYADAHFDGTLDLFKAQHPELFTKSGDLKSDYRRAEEIIARIERDAMLMKYLSGQRQIIMTGEIEGVPFKIMMDSYHPGAAIVDRKIMRDFEDVWKPGQGKLNFAEAWGYDIQGAIYQEIERQNSGGAPLPFILGAATKEPVTDLALISMPQHKMYAALAIVKALAPQFNDIKRGIVPPTRCEKCDYCKSTKVLTRVIDLDEFTGGLDHE